MRVVLCGLILLIHLTLLVKGCRKNCQVSHWSKWKPCSKQCGGGMTERSRYVTVAQARGGNGCPYMKEKKACNVQKCPINCVWGKWGPWASCVECLPGGRARTRIVARPSEFGGALCTGSHVQFDYNTCPAQVQCPPPKCSPSQFTCAVGGKCVDKHVTCNKDNDCEDFSDEKHCNTTHSPCGPHTYQNIPNADIAGAGYDITTMKERASFLANDKFNGQCPTVMSGDHKKLFRRPFNIQSYKFQVSASTSFKVDSYNSVESFFQAERKTVKKSFSFGGLLLGILTFGLSGSSSETMNRVLQWSTNSDTKIFKIYSEIHLANFAMKRPHSFITSHNFQVYVRDLPRTYDYAKYEAVIRRFGTHYYSSGYLGGRYEYIYRFSKSALRQSKLTEYEQKTCLGLEASAAYQGSSLSIGGSRCSSNSLSRKHAGSFTKSATDVISNVRGGTSGTAGALSFNNNKANKKNFNAWVASLKQHPAVVDFKLTPISAVFNDITKKNNMNKAIKAYLSKFDPAKCPQKCFNSGKLTVVDDGKTCKCLCKSNFGGISCELKSGAKPKVQMIG